MVVSRDSPQLPTYQLILQGFTHGFRRLQTLTYVTLMSLPHSLMSDVRYICVTFVSLPHSLMSDVELLRDWQGVMLDLQGDEAGV
jgi:hypothetical protein